MRTRKWIDDGYVVSGKRTLSAIRRVLIATMLLNFAATAIKLAAGIATGALSVVADSLDSLFDGLSNLVGLTGYGILAMPLEHGDDHINVAKKTLGDVPLGITHFILHPSIDTPELRAIAPDWRARVANYNAFRSDELKKFLESEAIKLIGYRALRNAMRNI